MRYWHNQQSDDGAMHTFGNGEMLAFACGPNLAALAGPPYTSPDILSLKLESNEPLCDSALREPGACIWQHTLRAGPAGGDNAVLARFTEFMLPDCPVYARICNQVQERCAGCWPFMRPVSS